MQIQSPATHEQRSLLIVSGLLGILGCVALAVGTCIAPFFVPDYNWISDTISDLAAGDSEIIMDVTLYLYAAGLAALGVGAAHAHIGRTGWSVGVMGLMLLAAAVAIIGARNEYGDADSDGIVIHIYVVYALGALFVLGPLCMANGAGKVRVLWRYVFWGTALFWIVMAPTFFMSPTSIDGLIERLLGLATFFWLCPLALILIQRGRQQT